MAEDSGPKPPARDNQSPERVKPPSRNNLPSIALPKGSEEAWARAPNGY